MSPEEREEMTKAAWRWNLSQRTNYPGYDMAVRAAFQSGAVFQSRTSEQKLREALDDRADLIALVEDLKRERDEARQCNEESERKRKAAERQVIDMQNELGNVLRRSYQ